ncbi:MAG: hypothetical protein M1822_001385 [Bathelium mastoideum]|nr:MAG: hypothetical protein M1822_001385 [Bathelium mastoideum]
MSSFTTNGAGSSLNPEIPQGFPAQQFSYNQQPNSNTNANAAIDWSELELVMREEGIKDAYKEMIRKAEAAARHRETHLQARVHKLYHMYMGEREEKLREREEKLRFQQELDQTRRQLQQFMAAQVNNAEQARALAGPISMRNPRLPVASSSDPLPAMAPNNQLGSPISPIVLDEDEEVSVVPPPSHQPDATSDTRQRTPIKTNEKVINAPWAQMKDATLNKFCLDKHNKIDQSTNRFHAQYDPTTEKRKAERLELEREANLGPNKRPKTNHERGPNSPGPLPRLTPPASPKTNGQARRGGARCKKSAAQKQAEKDRALATVADEAGPELADEVDRALAAPATDDEIDPALAEVPTEAPAKVPAKPIGEREEEQQKRKEEEQKRNEEEEAERARAITSITVEILAKKANKEEEERRKKEEEKRRREEEGAEEKRRQKEEVERKKAEERRRKAEQEEAEYERRRKEEEKNRPGMMAKRKQLEKDEQAWELPEDEGDEEDEEDEGEETRKALEEELFGGQVEEDQEDEKEETRKALEEELFGGRVEE